MFLLLSLAVLGWFECLSLCPLAASDKGLSMCSKERTIRDTESEEDIGRWKSCQRESHQRKLS
jgi:hypothetical protein